MIIDTALIICLIATHLVAALTPLIIRDQIWYARKSGTMDRLMKRQQRLIDENSGEFLHPGLIVTEIEPKLVTQEEHEKILAKKFSTQLKDYEEHVRTVNPRMDRYVLRLLIEQQNGNIKVTDHSEYTITFSSGDDIWVANKYYAYGRLYRSKNAPGLVMGSDFSVSRYTFLRVLELEEQLSDPAQYFTNPQMKVID